MDMATIREEKPEDSEAIWRVNEEAFGQPNEAALVAALRDAGAVTLSLVAERQDESVGHILFSPVRIEAGGVTHQAVALGPMAVAPAHQRQGIGSQLVRAGLARLKQEGHRLVIVLGHPGFYPRFGFKPAAPHSIYYIHDLPPEVFMVCELAPGALEGVQGVVHYRPEFAGL